MSREEGTCRRFRRGCHRHRFGRGSGLGAPVAAVTIGLGALAVVGGGFTAGDIGLATRAHNWDRLAYDLGALRVAQRRVELPVARFRGELMGTEVSRGVWAWIEVRGLTLVLGVGGRGLARGRTRRALPFRQARVVPAAAAVGSEICGCH